MSPCRVIVHASNGSTICIIAFESSVGRSRAMIFGHERDSLHTIYRLVWSIATELAKRHFSFDALPFAPHLSSSMVRNIEHNCRASSVAVSILLNLHKCTPPSEPPSSSSCSINLRSSSASVRLPPFGAFSDRVPLAANAASECPFI